MVILGGLEIVAAGVIIHKYTKNKEARLEEERQEEERRRRERKHHRKNSKRHDSRPPKDGDLGTGFYSQPSRAQSAPPPGYTPPQWQPQGPALPGYYPPQPWQQQQQQPPSQFNKNFPNWQPQQQAQNGYTPNWQAPIPQPQAQAPPQPQMQQRPRQADTFYDNPNHQHKDVGAGLPSNSSYERIPQAQHTGSSVQLPQNPQPQPQTQNQTPQPWQVQPLCAELSGESHRSRREQEHDAHSDTASTRYAPTELGDEHHNEPPPVYQPY